MQQVAYNRPLPPPSYSNSNGKRRGPSPAIALAAILMFALSGLLVGFAAGALTHKRTSTPTPDTKQDTRPVTTRTQTATQTTTTQKVQLGCPRIEASDGAEVANGSLSYTFAAQASDKSAGLCGPGNPVNAPGITCKLWLTKDDNPSKTLIPIIGSRLANVGTLALPMPGEVNHGLVFDSTTPQTQHCDAKGHATWKYGIAPSVHPGSYHLVVLTDWDGTYYSWSWANIGVKKNN